MDGQVVEHEICGNCKKEIPQPNYVMHTAHCARNITLCQTCKEPIPRNQYDEHKTAGCTKPIKSNKKAESPPPSPPPTKIENSQYFHERKQIEDRKIAARKERELKKYERFVDTGYTLKETPTTTAKRNGIATNETRNKDKINNQINGGGSTGAKPRSLNTATKLPPPATAPSSKSSNGLLACKFCELELPKLDLDDHENYCGSRTDKCLECGELVMFKYKQIHQDSNHGFLKLKDEPGPRPSWESTSNRSDLASAPSTTTTTRPRPTPFRPFTTVDATLYSFPTTLSTSSSASSLKKKDKAGESYKEISRRLDCPAPQPPRRRRNPPTELLIPCEFCQTPIPHEDLIQHETGCRPDLARFHPRSRQRGASSPHLADQDDDDDDYFVAPEPPNSPEVELPCEFCADMIPASQLLRHQATCA